MSAALQYLGESLAHLTDAERDRVRLTAGCTDCRSIPKVPMAGQTFTGSTSRWQLMHNGVRVTEDGYCGRWMTELIRLLEGHHEPQEELAFHTLMRYIPRGGTMIELGCWWAYYSLWFESCVPDAALYLVEPDPRNMHVGERNFALNEAAGHFFNYSIGRQSHPPRPFRCEDGLVYPVAQRAVDDLLDECQIDHVELLLADIQGAELEMLEGAVRSLSANRIRFLVISTHHHSLSGDPLTHQKCVQFLKDRRACFLAEHSVGESYSGDGLIVVSMDPRDRDLESIPISYNRPRNSLFRELEYDLADALSRSQFGPLHRFWSRWRRGCWR